VNLDNTELARKAVHIGAGLFALALRWTTWWQAALFALLAFLFNLYLLRHVGGVHLMRLPERERGYATGVLLYPLVVLALIVLFRHDLAIAAAGWAYLAFGDGCATLAGRALGGAALPWNRAKSWAGFAAYVAAGFLAAAAVYGFVRARMPSIPELIALFLASLVGAAVESLPSELDDNVAPPLMAASALAALLLVAAHPVAVDGRRLFMAVAVNALVAGLLGPLRVVRPSGVAAGFAAGTLIYALGGPAAYTVLWAFFATGTLATRLGRRRKEALGKAEEAGGRRGVLNVLANVTVPAFCFAAGGLSGSAALTLAGVAAFATAAMDTVGTEIGQAVRSRTVLLPDLKPVPPGTDGAVSIAGTLAGLLAAGLVAGVAASFGLATSARALAAVLLGATAGTVVESLLGRDGAPWRVTSGHVLNFYNTFAGAGAALMIAGS